MSPSCATVISSCTTDRSASMTVRSSRFDGSRSPSSRRCAPVIASSPTASPCCSPCSANAELCRRQRAQRLGSDALRGFPLQASGHASLLLSNPLARRRQDEHVWGHSRTAERPRPVDETTEDIDRRGDRGGERGAGRNRVGGPGPATVRKRVEHHVQECPEPAQRSFRTRRCRLHQPQRRVAAA